jgi:hypothetical protein
VQPGFTIVRENGVAFDEIRTIWDRGATMATAVSREGETERVPSVITNEHVADTVARSMQICPG